MLNSDFNGCIHKCRVYRIDVYSVDVHRFFDALENRMWTIKDNDKYAALHDIYFMLDLSSEGCCDNKRQFVKFTVVDNGVDFDAVDQFLYDVAQNARTSYMSIRKYEEDIIQW
jgi:hypothetical protein